MKTAYPVVFTPCAEGGYSVFVPDMNCSTQGDSLAEAIEMARDVVGLMGIDMQDDRKPLPSPSSLSCVPHEDGDIVSLVDIDFDAYRRANDKRAVRRNVTLPSWLNVEAEKAGINVSALLQTALKNELRLTDR